MGNAPVFTVKVSNKDGTKREFVNYAGERVTDKYERIGVLFQNKFGGYDLVPDKRVTLDPERVYCTLFAAGGKRDEAPKRAPRAPAAPQEPAPTEDELGF